MKLESQVCSLELAKQLKELGVKQDSLFYWHMPVYEDWCVVMNKNDMWEEEYVVSAFSVPELGRILPKIIKHRENGHLYWLKILCGDYDSWEVWYQNEDIEKVLWQSAKNEADCRAKMLIWLIENKYLDVKDLI